MIKVQFVVMWLLLFSCCDVTPHPQVVKQFSFRLAKPHPLGGVNWTGVQNRARQVGAGVTWLQTDRQVEELFVLDQTVRPHGEWER